MACETVVVSTRVGAVPELIVDGVNGYSAEVDDSQSLLSAIVALDQFPEKRVELAHNAKATVVRLPWGKALSPLEGVYDNLIERRSRMGPPLPGPAWMNDPEELMWASCAADALANVIPRIRTRSVSVVKGMRLLFEMLNQRSILDIPKGAAMVKGWSFRASSSRKS